MLQAVHPALLDLQLAAGVSHAAEQAWLLVSKACTPACLRKPPGWLVDLVMLLVNEPALLRLASCRQLSTKEQACGQAACACVATVRWHTGCGQHEPRGGQDGGGLLPVDLR